MDSLEKYVSFSQVSYVDRASRMYTYDNFRLCISVEGNNTLHYCSLIFDLGILADADVDYPFIVS